MPETSAEDVEEAETQTESVSGPGTTTPHQTEGEHRGASCY